MTPVLTITIPTVPSRTKFFRPLFCELLWQRYHLHYPEQVELIYDDRMQDEGGNKVTLGAKGNNLLNRANGLYVARFDDDDWPEPFYLQDMLNACRQGFDCVGMRIAMTTDGQRPQTCCHSLRYKEWAEGVDGYDYVRNVTQFNAVKTELARQAGFPEDIPGNYGDDKAFADAVTPLCQSEVMLERIVYNYRFRTMEQRIKDGDA